MRLALLLHAVNPRLGGVLIRGEKGTAKSTAVRALAALLPASPAVSGCVFGCNPDRTAELCESCTALVAGEPKPDVIDRPVSVVELPIGATEDRVLGSLDLEHAIQSGERRFEPGLLARANRGILYVDEVNLLGDHLVDVLLDAAALGWNYVEREGVSYTHPASFMLIGTMNPEEGDLRPQLLDRFALTVEVTGLSNPSERAEVVRRRIDFENDPVSFIARQLPVEQAERKRLARAREILPSVVVPDSALDLIVRICLEFDVDGLRCDLAMYRTAIALAAYSDRTTVQPEDVRLAAELALPHRRRRQPFDQTGLDQQRLDEIMNDHDGEDGPDGQEVAGKEADDGDGNHAFGGSDQSDGSASGAASGPVPRDSSSTGDKVMQPGRAMSLAIPRAPLRRRGASDSGRRLGRGRTHDGAVIGEGPIGPGPLEIAPMATLRAAAPHQIFRGSSGPAMQVLPADFRRRVRCGRIAELVLFVVDASGSMGARQRMQYAKSASLALLRDAYRKRDRVGVIAFRGDLAELLVPPTNSVDLAERRLRFLPSGGRTPLALGLKLARETLDRALQEKRFIEPVVILISDGKANVGLDGAGAWPAALRQAEAIRERSWSAMVVDASGSRAVNGLGRELAAVLNAPLVPIGQAQPADYGEPS
jgi:magnesium chelatase subunit D